MENLSFSNWIIFVQDHLSIGGIETYIFRHVRELKEENVGIVWVKKKNAKIDDSFRDELYDGRVVIWEKNVFYKKMHALIKQRQDLKFKIISFSLFNFSWVEKIRTKLNQNTIESFYFVPHFKGDKIFLEDGYSGSKKVKTHNRIQPCIQKMHSNGNIRYFAEKHIECMSERYGYSVTNYNDVLVPKNVLDVEFDTGKVMRLFNRKQFNILTVSRFEFPHKGYIIGLIRLYAKLKTKYENLTLTIVGYGEGLTDIKKEIAQLDDKVLKDIYLVGKVSADQLNEYYDDANVNISVAGCCSLGAKRGILSLPARHYTYSCEVYGYMPESKEYILSEEPGEPAERYIEEIINMDAARYLDLSKKCFDTYHIADADLPPKIQEIKNYSSDVSLSRSDILFMRFEHFKFRVRLVCSRIKDLISKGK